MIKQIIDISEAAYLHLKNQQLLIDKDGMLAGQIPIEDLGILILQHSAIVITQQLIINCQKNNVIIVFCDEKHLPYSVILPISESNTLHSKILKQQVSVSKAINNRLWKHIVQAKIKEQSATLMTLGKDSTRLDYLVNKVKNGDTGNSEAIAAQAYWKLLFGKNFRRNVNLEGVNSLLNYGYSIMRAMIARAICGAGLHPTLGLFHKNQYNALCLADDLMEPFRPWVDFYVYQLAQESTPLDVNRQNKQVLLNLLSEPVIYDKKSMPLMVASHYLMANLKRCYRKELKTLKFPVIASRLII